MIDGNNDNGGCCCGDGDEDRISMISFIAHLNYLTGDFCSC